MNENGLLKLADFCYALKVSGISENTRDADVYMKNKKGTPSYMAPELFEEFGV